MSDFAGNLHSPLGEAERESTMSQFAGVLTFVMIAFGMLTSCGQPTDTPADSSVIIVPQ
jgi:hypothetical protein